MATPYRARVSSARASSEKFGPCEICGTHVAEVHIGTMQRGAVLDGDTAEILNAVARERGRGRADYAAGDTSWLSDERSRFGHDGCIRGDFARHVEDAGGALEFEPARGCTA